MRLLPFYPSEELDGCTGQVICPFTATGRMCYCAPPVVRLGSWDPRPAPGEWPDAPTLSAPEPFGAYPCELRDGSPAVQAAPSPPAPEPGDMQLSPSWRDEMGFGP